MVTLVSDGYVTLLLCPNMTHVPTKKASVTVVTKAPDFDTRFYPKLLVTDF